MKIKLIKNAVLMLSFLMVTLAGCGEKGGSETTPTVAPTATPAATAAPTIAAVAPTAEPTATGTPAPTQLPPFRKLTFPI